ALPFAFSEDQAILRLSVVAATRAMGLGGEIFRSLCATYFPSLGFRPFRPVEIQAVYLPAWIINAEIQADGWLSSETTGECGSMSRMPSSLTHLILELHVECFAHDPLSHFVFRPKELNAKRVVPWSENLVHQHGSEVLCLPFTHSPFALLDAARSLSFKRATVSKRFRFDPPTVKANFFAAYPILIPVYLARY
ncbi:hypothetical protein B0H21DRAFT_694880, partial [Amylocystis lapponica]